MSNSIRSRLREDPFAHWLGLLFAIVVGFALASVHWLGLVAGGALVGLVTTSFKRGLLAGLGFGILAVFGWFGWLAFEGNLGAVLATGEFAAIAVLIGIIAPVFGSLVRGIV